MGQVLQQAAEISLYRLCAPKCLEPESPPKGASIAQVDTRELHVASIAWQFSTGIEGLFLVVELDLSGRRCSRIKFPQEADLWGRDGCSALER